MCHHAIEYNFTSFIVIITDFRYIVNNILKSYKKFQKMLFLDYKLFRYCISICLYSRYIYKFSPKRPHPIKNHKNSHHKSAEFQRILVVPFKSVKEITAMLDTKRLFLYSYIFSFTNRMISEFFSIAAPSFSSSTILFQ